MSDAEFEAWVEQHCEATAAPAEATASLLAESTRRAFGEWEATAGELGECTYRLIHGLKVPKFGNEHAEAVARELHLLRRERAAAGRPHPGAAHPIGGPVAPGPWCPRCRDSGLVPVPLFLCVEVPHHGPPRLVAHPGYKTVLTGSVLCSEGGCEPGRRLRDREGQRKRPDGQERRPTLAEYQRRFGGVDVAGLLERHERELVAAARRRAGPGAGDWAALVARIRARAAGTYTEDEAA